MPLYAYVCECGKSEDRFNRIADRHTNAPECHGPMRMELQPTYGYVQTECHYRSPLTGEPITSWRQRKYEMESKGYVDANDFKPKTAFKREEGELARRTSLANKLTGPLTRKDLEPHVPVI